MSNLGEIILQKKKNHVFLQCASLNNCPRPYCAVVLCSMRKALTAMFMALLPKDSKE